MMTLVVGKKKMELIIKGVIMAKKKAAKTKKTTKK